MKMDKAIQEVTSLELSRALKEAGYPQVGMWKWAYYGFLKGKETWDIERTWMGIMTVDVIAPTVAELGEGLPCGYASHKRFQDIDPNNPDRWVCGKDLVLFADTEANARAKTKLHLLKNG